MAAKDDILVSFLKHEVFISKYGLVQSEFPSTLRDALQSDKPIIKAIALIVDGLEKSSPVTDNELRSSVLQFLNTAR